MFLLWSIIISLGLMPYAVRYGSARVVCTTTGDSRQYDTSIRKNRRWSRGRVMINNDVAKCTLDDYTRNSWWHFKDEIQFYLRCKCKVGKRQVHSVRRRKKGFSNGSYEGFFACDASKHYRLWWSMKFKPNTVGDIVIAMFGFKPATYACGAASWQNDIGKPLHKLFGLDGNRCCEKHDRCYEKCGESKRRCDDKFAKCLSENCKRVRKGKSWACRATAAFTADLVKSAVSRKAFREAQRGCKHIRK